MWFLTLLLFIFILGLIILIHELGHFFWAKKFNVYIYEFSIGMGPILHTHKGKDGIPYNIRAFPIGGFVSMAGEVYEDDETNKIPKERFMCNRPWYQRIIILIAGVVNNFLLAIFLLFISSLIWGHTSLKPLIGDVMEGYPMEEAGIQKGDLIKKINGKKVNTWDKAQILLAMNEDLETFTFEIEHENGKIEEYKIAPKKVENEDGTETRTFGVVVDQTVEKGFLNSISYAFQKFVSIMDTMLLTIGGLFTGSLSLSALSGPVGIYKVVGQSLAIGLIQIIYITAFLSANVGFINILPFPAFDGGRVFFLIIEKIKGSPVNSKFENTCHTVGFVLLLLLMLFITIQDITRLF